MRYLLDTNTCIAAMRHHAAVLQRLASVAPADCAISSITTYELYTGIEKCADPAKESAKVNLLLATVNEAPRPEAEVSGRPPRGGHCRMVAPVGGVGVNPTGTPPNRSAEATANSPSEDRSPQGHPEDARRIARSSSGHTARGRGFKNVVSCKASSSSR
jgi:hypothetical protein